MHLLKQADIFTGTTLFLDIILLLRLVKTSNKSEWKSITHDVHSDNNFCQRASSPANNRERHKRLIQCNGLQCALKQIYSEDNDEDDDDNNNEKKNSKNVHHKRPIIR